MAQWTWVFCSAPKHEGFHDSSVGKESAYEIQDLDFWVGKITWQRDRLPTPVFLGFHGGSAGKESACNEENQGSIPGLGRSPGEGYSLQYSCLENSMDCIVHGVAKSQTGLSDFHFHFLNMILDSWLADGPNNTSVPGYLTEVSWGVWNILGGAWIPHIIVNSFSAEEPLLCASKTHSPFSVIPHMACSWHCLLHSCFLYYSWSNERVRAMCIFQNSERW